MRRGRYRPPEVVTRPTSNGRPLSHDRGLCHVIPTIDVGEQEDSLSRLSLASLVYGSNPTRQAVRSVVDGRRAVYPRSSVAPLAARPAQPVAHSLVAPSLVPQHRRHIGCPPWDDNGSWTSCVCDCHGDPSLPCDVKSCVDIDI